MMFFYKYEVQYYDDFKGYSLIKTGLTCGESTVEVVERLASYYGDDNISELSIQIIDESEAGVLEDE